MVPGDEHEFAVFVEKGPALARRGGIEDASGITRSSRTEQGHIQFRHGASTLI
jgi:hypothetical protein